MFFRVLFGPVVFAALVVTIGITAACGSDDPATATSTSSASQPTATATATATPTTEPTITPSPTATTAPQPTATLTPEPAPVMLKDLDCTQLFPGAYDPHGPRSVVTLSAKLVNTGDEDVAVKVSSLGGAIMFAELFRENGESVVIADTTLAGVTKLEPGVEHDISISKDLYDSTAVYTCEFGILGEDSTAIELSGETSGEVERIYAP